MPLTLVGRVAFAVVLGLRALVVSTRLRAEWFSAYASRCHDCIDGAAVVSTAREVAVNTARLVSKLHILRMSVDTVPVATNHGGTARQCNPLDLLAYPSYMMLQYAPVRCIAGHVLAVISNTNTSGRGPWRPGAGVVGAGWVAPLPPVPFFLWYRHCWRCTLCA